MTYLHGGLALALGAAVWLPVSADAGVAATCDMRPATIVGTEGPDEIVGLPGVDIIAVLGGDDRITGDLKGDVICGGDGDDTVLSSAGAFTAFGGPGDDHLEVIGGGPYTRADLFGNDGNDVLVAGATRASMFGGVGDDTLLGGKGVDFLYPGLGRDVVDGGGDLDSLTMEQDAGPVSINLARGVATGQGRDALSNVEIVVATPYADRLIGNDGPNTLTTNGSAGSELDVVHGRGGNDIVQAPGGTLLGGRGDDRIDLNYCCARAATDDEFDGGAGFDRIIFHYLQGPVLLDLAAGTASGAAIGHDAALRFEAANGTEAADTFLGDDASNRLFGRDGADRLDGRGGDDTLLGSGDDDTLLGGPGDDHLDGGRGEPGSDTLDGGPGLDTCVRGESTTNCEG